MAFLDALEVINIVLFFIPGYLVLYSVTLITDYLYEKNQLDRVVQYLIFSFFCYVISSFILFSIFIISLVFKITTISDVSNWIKFFRNNLIFLSIIAILISPFLGFYLGTKYFGKGYPHKHFLKYTTKKYTPSIYAEFFLREYKKGAWVTCHMKDGSIVQGKLSDYDKDEDKRDYLIAMTDVEKHYPEKSIKIKLPAEKVVINLKNTYLVEFNK